MALTVDLPIYFSEKYPSDWVKSGIYRIKSPSGSVYIGQSVDLKRRFVRYKSLDCKTQIALFRSFSKYGVEAHLFSILKEVEESRYNTLTALEQHYIDLHRNKGFNILNIKEAGSCGKLSEETKKKIGDAVRGEKNGNFGRKFTQEHCDKLSEALKGKPAYWKGKQLTPEAKLKISEAKKGKKTKPCSEEAKAKIAASQKGVPRQKLSPENKKIALANLVRQDKALIAYNDIGEYYEFKSGKEAISFLGIKYNQIYKVLDGDKLYKGYYWKTK